VQYAEIPVSDIPVKMLVNGVMVSISARPPQNGHGFSFSVMICSSQQRSFPIARNAIDPFFLQHVICAPATVAAWIVPNLRAQHAVLSGDVLQFVAPNSPLH
jgi:hypothetical protein